jgi:hypothetical protein
LPIATDILASVSDNEMRQHRQLLHEDCCIEEGNTRLVVYSGRARQGEGEGRGEGGGVKRESARRPVENADKLYQFWSGEEVTPRKHTTYYVKSWLTEERAELFRFN